MRYVLMGMVCFFFAVAAYAQENIGTEHQNVVALAMISRSRPYKDLDAEMMVVPAIMWQYKRFFIEGAKAGFIVKQEADVRFDLFVEPRFMGYDADDGSFLNGMEDRTYSLDGGIRFKKAFPLLEAVSITSTVVADMLSEHEGYQADVDLARPVNIAGFRLTPRIGVRWQSEELVEYYYGVRPEEVSGERTEYHPDDAINFLAHLQATAEVTGGWVVFAGMGLELLSDEIRHSPLLEDDYIISAMLGVTKRF